MTLTPPKRSQVGRYWHYMHRHNSLKLTGDSQTVFLMSNLGFNMPLPISKNRTNDAKLLHCVQELMVKKLNNFN
jgi:hypothetical protein